MKKSKQELLNAINELEVDEDVKITLLEDISDSVDDSQYEQFKAQYEQEKADLEAQIANEKAYITELKNRYKERFLTGIDEDNTEKNDTSDNNEDELIEKEIVNITEI